MNGSSAVAPALLKRRNAMILSGVATTGFIGVGVYCNVFFQEVVAGDTSSVLAMSVVCLAPFVGLPALFIGSTILASIQKKVIPASLLGVTRLSRILGAAGMAVNSALLIWFVLQTVTLHTDRIREVMLGELQVILKTAVDYRLQSDTTGHSGSYAGYVIPSYLATSEAGTYARHVIHKDTVVFIGRWLEDSTAAMVVKLGPDGKAAGAWGFYGSFAE